MRRAAVCALLVVACGSAGAEQAYWTCRDEMGRKQIQDRPCAEAPDAAPTGIARPANTVPALKPERVEASSSTATEADTGQWWSQQFQRLRERVMQAGGEGGVLRHPWVHLGAGVLVLLALLVWVLRRVLPKLRERKLVQAATAQPDPYRRALSGVDLAPAATAPRERAMTLEEAPTHWSPELMRKLGKAQFALLARRLWQLRGLKVEGDDPLLLRYPANLQALHGAVLCRPAESQGAAAARELFGLMQHHRCEYGAVMSPGEFDIEARDFVRGKNIELKGWATLMTEVEALSEEQRATLLVEVLRKPASA